MLPPAEPKAWFESTTHDHRAAAPARGAPEPDVDADTMLIRPFLVTGGRTRPLHAGLRMETMVRAEPAALRAPLRFEQRRVVELAQQPISVAEVAALLDIPLGVARVLLADLCTGNYLTLHEPTELPAHMIERIRDLVRAL